MRLPFVSRRAFEDLGMAHSLLRGRLVKAEGARETAERQLADAHAALTPVVVERTELWSLIDWSLWGSGMGDVFREQLADQFIAALTPEQHAQALELIRWWTEDRGREPLGRRRYEDQQRRLHRALRSVAALRNEAAVQRRVTDRLTTQLLDATGYQGEPLLPAARATLGIEKEVDA